jgi:integrase
VKVGTNYPTKTPGIYQRLRANGSKVFLCRYSASDGRRVMETCGTMMEAKARLAEVSGKKFKGEQVTGSVTTTVAELIEGRRAVRDVKASSVEIEERNLRLHIEPRWGRVRAKDVTKAAILAWLRSLEKQNGTGALSEATRRLILSHFSVVLDYGVDAGVLNSNPVKALGRKQKPRAKELPAWVLGPGELEALLDGYGGRDWLRDVIVVTLGQALRLGEAVGLRGGDVDFEAGKLTVARQEYKDGSTGTPKGGKVATIDLLPEARKTLLRLHMAQGRPADGPVFHNGSGGPLRYAPVQDAFRVVRKRAGLSTEPRAFRFHDLRHSAITRLANARLDLAEAALAKELAALKP